MNAKTLIIAGSETTAVTLDGATYLLCTHPEVLAKLTAEVRSSFTCEDNIDLSSVGRLKYMLAVLDESMRMFGATAGGLPPRVIRKGGDVICGRFLPEGVSAIHHDPNQSRPLTNVLTDADKSCGVVLGHQLLAGKLRHAGAVPSGKVAGRSTVRP